MTMKQMLEQQAYVIDQTLAQRGTAGRVTGGNVNPEWIRFIVTPADGVTPSAIKDQADHLARALEAPSLRVSRRGAVVAVEIPHPDPQPVRLLPFLEEIGSIPALTAALGVCDDGAPLLIRLPASDVGSVAVVGEGRVGLLRAMALSLALRNPARSLRLVLVGDGLADLASVPHVGYHAATAGTWEAVNRLARLVAERQRLGEASPSVAAFVTDLQAVGRKGEAILKTILHEGPSSGVYLVAASATDTPHLPFGPRMKNERDKWTAHTLDDRRWTFFPATISPQEVRDVVDALKRRRPHRAALSPALVDRGGAPWRR